MCTNFVNLTTEKLSQIFILGRLISTDVVYLLGHLNAN